MQANSAAITVFIPTYNRHQWLKQAVESVLQETRVPILLHVFDNASTDGTEAFVSSLSAADARVRYTRQPENVGGTNNYRTAFQSISTEYFVPLADDDWLLPGYLFEAYHEIQQQHELGAVIFVTEGRNESGEVLGQYPAQVGRRTLGFLTPEAHLRDWMRYGHYHWSSVLWRKNALDSVGLSFLDVGLPGDVDFQLQVFCRHPVVLVNKPGAVYRLHTHQTSRDYNLANLESWALVFRRLDRTMRECQVFAALEYSQLRTSMQSLFKPLWNIPADPPLDGPKLLSTAVSAGFRLGDWDLAFDLIDRYAGTESVTERDATIKSFVLPEFAIAVDPDASERLSRISGLLPSIVAWFKLTDDTIRRSDIRPGANPSPTRPPVSRTAESSSQISICLNEIDALKSSVARWRAKAERAKAENKRLKAKINTMREERKKQSETRLPARIRRWWRQVRGKACPSQNDAPNT